MKHIFDDFVNIRVTFPDVWGLRLDRCAKAKKDREGGTEPMKGILSHAWSQRIFWKLDSFVKVGVFLRTATQMN